MCVFLSLTGYADDGGCENRNADILIIIEMARLRPLHVRTTLSPHPSLAAELAYRTPGKINES